MTKKRASLSSLFMVAVVAVASLPARPASAKVDVSTFKLRNKSLSADFEDASDDTCFVTQTHVSFSESVEQVSGTPFVGAPTTLVTLDYSNSCTGEFLSMLGGTTQQSVRIAADLSSATLSAVVPVSDDAGHSTEITLTVTWKANAPAQVDKSTTLTRTANVIMFERFNRQARPADVSGTVAALLPVQGVPTDFDLSLFPEGGTLGKNVDSQRTVTFLKGRR